MGDEVELEEQEELEGHDELGLAPGQRSRKGPKLWLGRLGFNYWGYGRLARLLPITPKDFPTQTGAPLPLRKQANQTLGRASFQFSAASIRAQGP